MENEEKVMGNYSFNLKFKASKTRLKLSCLAAFISVALFIILPRYFPPTVAWQETIIVIIIIIIIVIIIIIIIIIKTYIWDSLITKWFFSLQHKSNF